MKMCMWCSESPINTSNLRIIKYDIARKLIDLERDLKLEFSNEENFNKVKSYEIFRK